MGFGKVLTKGEWTLMLGKARGTFVGLLAGMALTGFLWAPVTMAQEGEGEGDVPLFHSADQNQDNEIDLSELLRVIQFFNSDGFHCEVGTEDGYNPGPGDQSCTTHGSDYFPQDWGINLSEMLRVIQFFNPCGFHACPYEDPPTEDDFCPRTC
jgi:hypothetical protein